MYSVMFFNLICRIEYEVQTQWLTEKKLKIKKYQKKQYREKKTFALTTVYFSF